MEHLISSLYGTFGYVGIVLAMAIESACIPLPSEIIMPLAGFMTVKVAGQHASFSLFGVSLAGTLGCVLGSLVAYGVGAGGGRALLVRSGRAVFISPRAVARADAYFARYGPLTVFLSRILPIVRTFISLPAGIARMRLLPFVLLTFLGSLPWCLALALVGAQLGVHWQAVGGWLRAYEVLVVAVVVVAGVVMIRRHRTQRTGLRCN